MLSHLQNVHRVWREAAAVDAPGAELRVLTELERCSSTLLDATTAGMGGVPMTYPLDAAEHFAVHRDSVLSAFELARAMLDLDTVAAAVEAVTAAQRGLQTGRASLGLGVAAALGLDVLDLATAAVHYMELGLKNRVLGDLPAGGEARAQRPTSAPQQPSTTVHPSSQRQVSDVLSALLRQLCSEKVLSAAAGLLSALAPAKEQQRRRAGAAAAPLQVNWDRRRFFANAPAMVEGAALTLPCAQAASSLPNLLQTTMIYVYGTVYGVYNKAIGPVCDDCDELVKSLTSGLEKSMVLEVAATTLLNMPTPTSEREVELATLFLARVTADLSCSSVLLSSLALLVMGGGLGFGLVGGGGGGPPRHATSGGPVPQSWVNSKTRPSLYGKLCGLLLQPSLTRFQRVLLDKFCLNGGVPRRGDVGTTSSGGGRGGRGGGGGGGGGGSGWDLMEKLLIDDNLCVLYGFHEDDEPDDPLPGRSGAADRAAARIHAVMVLTSPALELWGALSTSPDMHPHLPPDLDDCLSRALEAALRLIDGKGAPDSPCWREVDIRQITTVVLKSWLVSAGVWQDWTVPPQPELAAKLRLTPAALEALGWHLAAQSRLAPLLREATRGVPGAGGGGGGGGAAAREELPLAAGHWLRMLTEALHYWSRPEVTKVWRSFNSKTKQDVIRRLVRADLPASLDRALRICATHGGVALLFECAISAWEPIVSELLIPILEEQLRVAPEKQPPAGARGSAATPANGEARVVDLGPLVTVAKLAGRFARELDAATAAAAAAGGIFSRRGSSAVQHRALQDLKRKRYLAFLVCNGLTVFCSRVGPVGYDAGGAATKLAERPDVAAVSELCARAAVVAGRAYLASYDAEQRLVARPLRNPDRSGGTHFSGGRAGAVAGGGCLFKDSANPDRVRVGRTMLIAPACLTAVLAEPGRAPPGGTPPVLELLAALRPQELLADCAGLILDRVQACLETAETAGASGGVPRSGERPAPAGTLDGVMFSRDAVEAGRAVNQAWIAVMALAAREDTAPHMYTWLGGGGGSSGGAGPAAGTGAGPGAPIPRLREALEQLMAGAPEWLLNQGPLDMRKQLRKLLAAVARGDDSAGGGEGSGRGGGDEGSAADGSGGTVEAMREVAKAGLMHEYQADFLVGVSMGRLAGVSVEIADLRRGSPAFLCALGMQAAGMEPAVDRRGVRVVPKSPLQQHQQQQQGLGCGPLLVKVCGNPGCDNFEEACEAALRLKKCGRCLRVRYCSTACQQQHWKEHKKTCGVGASRG